MAVVRQDRLYNPVGFFTSRAETYRIAVEHDPYVRDARQDELLVRVGYYLHEVARMIPGKWVVAPRTGVERRVWDGLMVTSAIYSTLKTQGYANWFTSACGGRAARAFTRAPPGGARR